jgi:pimeloyl-ACP methyl ester carboxylesterase
MTGKIIEADGVQIEIKLNGDKEPLVIMLPGHSRGADDFDELASLLADSGWRTAAVNPRGAGKSTGPMENLTLHDLASDVAMIIESLEGAPAALIGHAFGNRIARCLAADRPDLVSCVILLAAGGKVPPLPEYIEAMTILGSKPGPEERSSAMRAAYFAQDSDPTPWLSGFYQDTGRAQGQAGRNTPLEEWWSGGEAPMLVLQGKEDVCAPPANGHQLKKEYGDRIEVVDIPNAAHALLFEQPEIIAGRINDFLRRQFQ